MFMCLPYHNVGNFFRWAVGHMCNVNMCIMFCKWLCYVGSRKSSFITTHWVGIEFNVCWCILKPLDSNDNTSQLNMYEINCDFFIHEACSSCLDYIGRLDSNYSLKVFSTMFYFNLSYEMYILFVLVNHYMFPCILSLYV